MFQLAANRSQFEFLDAFKRNHRVKLGFPSVRVPVLSMTRVSPEPKSPRLGVLIKIPRGSRLYRFPTIIDIGVGKPRAARAGDN